MIVYLMILAVVLIINYFVAKQFESVAYDKGYNDSKYFHFCFWLGIVGYLLVIALPDRGSNRNTSLETTSEADVPQKEEPFVWQPASESSAMIVGETNIKCANCHRIQFKGNKSCTQCGAKFTEFEQ